MSDRIFTLLLSLSLTLQNVCSGFQVWTFLQYNFYNNDSVNIICQHDAPKEWTMDATVLINGENVCSTDQNNAACNKTNEGNKFNFTLNITSENKRFWYRCMVFRSSPLPILWRQGEDINWLPGCALPPLIQTNSCNCSEVGNNCPHVPLISLLSWALLGIVLLLSLYSLIITAFYINLRRKFSEELTVTYVPMQQNQIRLKKKVKGHGADKNAEYMDMREVHHHAQHIRDVNHNSCPNPVGFSV